MEVMCQGVELMASAIDYSDQQAVTLPFFRAPQFAEWGKIVLLILVVVQTRCSRKISAQTGA